MSKLLDERPIVIQPSIVKALGFERAVILQQIHYHLESPKSGKVIEGFKWIWNTYEEWAEEFTFWEPRTIRKWMAKLEEDGLIITAQFDKADWNRRKYYRIDYDVFNVKTGASKRHDDDTSEILEDDSTMRHDDDTSRSQHGDASYKEAKTSTKTSTEREKDPPATQSTNPLSHPLGIALLTSAGFTEFQRESLSPMNYSKLQAAITRLSKASISESHITQARREWWGKSNPTFDQIADLALQAAANVKSNPTTPTHRPYVVEDWQRNLPRE